MSSSSPTRNRLLDALDRRDLDAFRPHLVEVQFSRDTVLNEPETDVDTVYFPTGAVLSLIVALPDGQCVQASTVGVEGAYGVLHALGSPVAQDRAMVQAPGRCLLMSAAQLRAATAASPRLAAALITNLQSSLAQVRQSVACNALHGVTQRLCRWLLMSLDRVGEPVLPLTQESLAIMLGVQRTTVTSAARSLSNRGWIRYSRGRIEILDRLGLEAGACDCYAAVRQKQAQLDAPGGR